MDILGKVPATEATLLRLGSYAAYATGTTGVAVSLGGWLGWLVVAASGAVPGAYLLRHSLDEQAIRRDRARYAPESYSPPPPARGEDGAVPHTIAMPPSH